MLSRALKPFEEYEEQSESDPMPLLGQLPRVHTPPKLNIVIQLVGSRGDIQPFISLALELQKFRHRVRIATHPIFQALVEDNGLEFFSIGGDPAELMAYMVRNPGLLPSYEAVAKGDVRRKRVVLQGIMERCWLSCIEPGDVKTKTADQVKTPPGNPKPFVADAIIANPLRSHIFTAPRSWVYRSTSFSRKCRCYTCSCSILIAISGCLGHRLESSLIPSPTSNPQRLTLKSPTISRMALWKC